MSIHHFDMMRCMTQASPEAVYAHEFNPHGSWYKGDVAVTAIFEMSGGLVFTYRGCWCVEGHNTSWNGNWRFTGDKGSILMEADKVSVAEIAVPLSPAFPTTFIRPKDKVELAPVPAGVGGQKESLERFLKAIDTGEAPETSCADNLHSFAMVCGAVESATKKQRVAIKL
jgi:predicted dehydrogenase